MSARPLDETAPRADARLDALARLVAIVDRLRAPDGCPWDLEQTVDSMAPSLVEEAHEMLEAIEAGSDAATVEEAGDLLLVVVLICRIAQDEDRFDLARCAREVGDKLIRRHPHVFGSEDADGAAHVAENWERIKRRERAAKREDTSALAGVPRALPALQRAQRLGAKAVAAGFRWTDAAGALAKLHEEVRELTEAFERAGAAGDPSAPGAELEAELGDVCLAAAQLGVYLRIDAERATRAAGRRFEGRFRHLERELGERMREASLDELLAAWSRAKAAASAEP